MSMQYHTLAQHTQYTQLVSYIRRGQVSQVLSQLSTPGSPLVWSVVRQRDRHNRTLLHHAAESGPGEGHDSTRVMRALLEVCPSELLEAQDTEGSTPLHLGVIAGNIPLVRVLVEHMTPAQVSIADYELHTPLHWAVVCGELAALQLLLEAGASLDTPDIYGAHPLHYATQSVSGGELFALPAGLGRPGRHVHHHHHHQAGWHIRILHYLLATRLHVDVNCTDNEARTPLIWAASSGNHEALHALVKAGAEVSQQDKEGLSDVHQTDGSGCTPLFYATALGHADCVRLIIQAGTHLDHQDNKGRTAAHCGASKGQLETLRILHQHGANLALKNVRGDLPLHEAVKSGRKDLVRWLLDLNRKSVNEVNLYGRSALHIAAFNNNLELVQMLVEDYGADVNSVMKVRSHYLTPLDAAHQNAADDVAAYLPGQGGKPIAQINQRVDEYLRHHHHHQPDATPTSADLDHFVGFDSSLEESEEYRAMRQRYARSKRNAQHEDNATKLPNLVKNGQEDARANHNNTRALSNTSSGGSAHVIHHAREFDDRLAPCGHHHHLRQAIITNVYLTTPPPPALTSPTGGHRRTPAPIRRGKKKLKKTSTTKAKTNGDKDNEEDDEEEEDDDGHSASSGTVKVTIDAKDTFVSSHEVREERVELVERLKGTGVDGTKVVVESLTKTRLECADSDDYEEENVQVSRQRRSKQEESKHETEEEIVRETRRKRSIEEEELREKIIVHGGGDETHGQQQELSMIDEEDGDVSKVTEDKTAVHSNKTSRENTIEERDDDREESEKLERGKRSLEEDIILRDFSRTISDGTSLKEGDDFDKTSQHSKQDTDAASEKIMDKDEDDNVSKDDLNDEDQFESDEDQAEDVRSSGKSVASGRALKHMIDKHDDDRVEDKQEGEEKAKSLDDKQEDDGKHQQSIENDKDDEPRDDENQEADDHQDDKSLKVGDHQESMENEKVNQQQDDGNTEEEMLPKNEADSVNNEEQIDKEEDQEHEKEEKSLEKKSSLIEEKDEHQDQTDRVDDGERENEQQTEKITPTQHDEGEDKEKLETKEASREEEDDKPGKEGDQSKIEDLNEKDKEQNDGAEDDQSSIQDQQQDKQIDDRSEQEIYESDKENVEKIIRKRSVESLKSEAGKSLKDEDDNKRKLQPETSKDVGSDAEKKDSIQGSSRKASLRKHSSDEETEEKESIQESTGKDSLRKPSSDEEMAEKESIQGSPSKASPRKLSSDEEGDEKRSIQGLTRQASLRKPASDEESDAVVVVDNLETPADVPQVDKDQQRRSSVAHAPKDKEDFRDNATFLKEHFEEDDEDAQILAHHFAHKQRNVEEKHRRRVNRQYAHIRPKVDTFWSHEGSNMKEQLNGRHSRSVYLDASTAREGYDKIDPAIIEQTVEKYIRKYYLERKLFEELYDLKRFQIRTGRSNEPQMVKRLADKFKRDTRAPGMADFHGPYTYKAYEMFLYDQLRHLSRSNDKKIARLHKSMSLEDVHNSGSSSYEDYHEHWESSGEEPTTKAKRTTGLEFEKKEAGPSIDYKYEYHKSQHFDQHSNDMFDVTLENLYKRTGFNGHKMDEMEIVRKSIERKVQASKAKEKEKAQDKDNKERPGEDNNNNDKQVGSETIVTHMDTHPRLTRDQRKVELATKSSKKMSKTTTKRTSRETAFARTSSSCRLKSTKSVIPGKFVPKVEEEIIAERWRPIKRDRRQQLDSHSDRHIHVLYEINTQHLWRGPSNGTECVKDPSH